MHTLLHKLRALFLSPGSKLELFLRSTYHRIQATRVGFLLQDLASKCSCLKLRFRSSHNPPISINSPSSQPLVTFLIDGHDTSKAGLLKTIESLIRMKLPDWYACVCSDQAFINHEVMNNLPDDTRISTSNTFDLALLEDLQSEFVVFLNAGDVVDPKFLNTLADALDEDPTIDLFYFDNEQHSTNLLGCNYHFKPQKVSPDLLLSWNYLTRAAISCSKLRGLIPFLHNGEGFQNLEGEIDYLLLEKGTSFHHIPKMLIAQAAFSEVNNESVIIDHATKIGLRNPSMATVNRGKRLTWDISESPSVAIIIPTKNNYHFLEPLISSILELTDYENYSISIVDNGSTSNDATGYYKMVEENPRIDIIAYNKEFNYSKAINFGVKNTSSDLLLFLNDDMKVIDSFWMSELVMWATRPDIGVVGAKLLRKNNTIQHAGIVLGMNGLAGHIYQNAPEHYYGLVGSVDWYRNYLAVTGACQMVRREVFEAASGYDEGFRIAFGDIDFCLRVVALGYRNLYTPFCRLYHYEGGSRGYETPREDILRGYEKMGELLKDPDPNFPSNLSYTKIPRYRKNADEQRRNSMIEREKFYQKNQEL